VGSKFEGTESGADLPPYGTLGLAQEDPDLDPGIPGFGWDTDGAQPLQCGFVLHLPFSDAAIVGAQGSVFRWIRVLKCCPYLRTCLITMVTVVPTPFFPGGVRVD
jgi:hypothetical protein